MRGKRWKHVLKGTFLSSASALILGYALSFLGLWESLEYDTWAWRVKLLAEPGPASGSIALILIDQASLDWGRRENSWPWPWPREVYSAIINFCRRGGAKAIVLDLLFSEPSWAGEDDDLRLGEALRGGGEFLKGAPSVVGLFLGESTEQANRWPVEVPKPPWKIEGLQEYLKENPGVPFELSHAAFPVLPIARAASCLANVREAPGEEGVLSKVTLFQGFAGFTVPSLGIAPFLIVKGRLSLILQEGKIFIGDRQIPVDRLCLIHI